MRIRRSLLNFATMVLFTVVTMAVALVATPWLETWLGRERFGAFRILFDCLGYLTLLELGLGGALSPLIARALGRGDEPALRKTVAVGTRAYLSVSILTVVVGLALVPVIPRFVADLPPRYLPDLRMAWVVGLSGFLSLSLLPFRTVLDARQLGYRINLLMVAQSLLITGVALVLARGGWGITGQSIAHALGTWFVTLAMAGVALRVHPGLLRSARAESGDRETLRAIWRLSLPTLLFNLSGRVSLMTDNIVVGAMLGAGTVTTLFFTQRLAVLAQSLLQGVGGATWAALAELHAKGEHNTFNSRLIELSGLIALLSVAGLAPIVGFNRSFLGLWRGPSYPYGGDAVIALAALNAFLQSQFSLWAWCFTATGKAPRIVANSVLASVVNLAASLLLTPWLGMAGPLLGTTFAFVAVVGWWLPRALQRDFGTSPTALARAVLPSLAFGLPYAAGLVRLARWHPPRSWFELSALMSLSALAVLALGFASRLRDPEQRALWHVRLRGLRPASQPVVFAGTESKPAGPTDGFGRTPS